MEDKDVQDEDVTLEQVFSKTDAAFVRNNIFVNKIPSKETLLSDRDKFQVSLRSEKRKQIFTRSRNFKMKNQETQQLTDVEIDESIKQKVDGHTFKNNASSFIDNLNDETKIDDMIETMEKVEDMTIKEFYNSFEEKQILHFIESLKNLEDETRIYRILNLLVNILASKKFDLQDLIKTQHLDPIFTIMLGNDC